MTNNTVNVAYITDSNYLMPTYISVLSLKMSMSENSNYCVFLIISEDKLPDLKLFENMQTSNFKVIPILKAKPDVTDLSNPNISNYSPAIFIKMELEKILSDCSKVLFLDSDIIVKKDLTDMYETNLNNCYIGGCTDPRATLYHIKNNKKYKNYFNTGVMLLNLEEIRTDKFFEKAIKYYTENGQKYKFPEQDTLNNIIGDKLKVLHPKYNWLVCNIRENQKFLQKFYHINSLSEVKEENIAILHYAGVKPWISKNIHYGKYWELVYYSSDLKNTTLKRINKYPIWIRLYVKIRAKYRYLKDKKYYKALCSL